MTEYKKLLTHRDINKILDSINDMLPTGAHPGCHGRNHALYVVNITRHILQSLAYSTHVIEMGKIAALLHDIGNIAGRHNHAKKSAALASIFLDDITDLTPKDKTTVIQAIEDHSAGNYISSAVGAAVFIADKVDITKSRVRPIENIDPWHINIMEIEDMALHISCNTMIINFTTTEAFSKELLINEYQKKLDQTAKAAEHLGCKCHIQFNGGKVET